MKKDIQQTIATVVAYWFQNFKQNELSTEEVQEATNRLAGYLHMKSMDKNIRTCTIGTKDAVPCRALIQAISYTKLPHKLFHSNIETSINFDTGKIIHDAQGIKSVELWPEEFSKIAA